MGDRRKTGASMTVIPPLGKRIRLDDSLVRRREVITLLGGAAASSALWPLAARAQQPAMPVVGFIRSTSLADSGHLVAAFRQSLKEAGFVEGQNVTIEYRWAENKINLLPALVAELIGRKVAVIVSNTPAARAAKAATKTVPIVFVIGSDPVRDGFVTSLNRPGGNVTGVVFFSDQLEAKRLDLLRRLVPKATTIAMLVNPNSSDTEAEQRTMQAGAQAIGQQLIVLNVGSARDIEAAFASFMQRGAGALLVGSGAFLFSNREQVVALAARHAIPAIYTQRAAVVSGGLMCYGPGNTDAYRQAGIYAGRVLKGEKPGDLPVMRSSKFEFVINLKTAKALGLEIPPTLLALADEVIE
jgi:putative ABC transport system substrate-binding protein